MQLGYKTKNQQGAAMFYRGAIGLGVLVTGIICGCLMADSSEKTSADQDGKTANASQNAPALVRFVRLKHQNMGWDMNFGKDGDLNLLEVYAARTGEKVKENTESIEAEKLGRVKPAEVPALLYIVGEDRLDLTDKEIAALKHYITKQNGMLFGDAASPHFGKAFKAAMKRILPDVKPVTIEADDDFLTKPYRVDWLPFASPHDPPMTLTGWKVGDRWVAIYHPGDIGDLWKSGHSGAAERTGDTGYSFGINVMSYAQRKAREEPKK